MRIILLLLTMLVALTAAILCIPSGKLSAEADESGAAGARAIRLQKTLIRQWDTEPLAHAIEAGMRSFASAYETDEPRRLMQKFLDRPRNRHK